MEDEIKRLWLAIEKLRALDTTILLLSEFTFLNETYTILYKRLRLLEELQNEEIRRSYDELI